MKKMNERLTEPQPTSDFERSAKQRSTRACAASMRRRARGSSHARERALQSAGGARWLRVAPVARAGGAIAAAAVVAVLAARASPRAPTGLGLQQAVARRSRDLARRGRSRDARRGHRFLCWLEDQPDSRRPQATAMASADAAQRGGFARRAVLRARGRGAAARAAGTATDRGAEKLAAEERGAGPRVPRVSRQLAGRRRRVARDQGMGPGRRAQRKTAGRRRKAAGPASKPKEPAPQGAGNDHDKLSRIVLSLACVLALLAGAAHAQGVAWEDLSAAQRQVLAGHAQHWKDLDPARQEQIALGAQRWLDMNGRTARPARDRFRAWQQHDARAAPSRARSLSAVSDAAAGGAARHRRRVSPLPESAAGATPGATSALPQLTPEQRQALRERRLQRQTLRGQGGGGQPRPQ